MSDFLEEMKITTRIHPCSAHSFELSAGEELVIIDPQGQQVGDLIDMASLKEITGLSRKYAIPFCLRMEMDGWVRREENERRVLRLPESQDALQQEPV
mgnify:CR=1 FL=1